MNEQEARDERMEPCSEECGWCGENLEARGEREALADDIHRSIPMFSGRGLDALHTTGGDNCWALADGLIAAGYQKHPEPENTDEIKQLIDELHGVTVVFGDMSPIGNIARRARAAVEAVIRVPVGEGEQ